MPTLAQALHSALTARANCLRRNNPVFKNVAAAWTDYIERVCRECLPSGSGFDNGSKVRLVDVPVGAAEQLVFETAFHHMNETGFYTHWTEHVIRVRPSFSGIFLSVSGRNDNEIKDYIAETFQHALTQECPVKFELPKEESAP